MKKKSWSGIISVLLVVLLILTSCAPKDVVKEPDPKPEPDVEKPVIKEPVLLGATPPFQPKDVVVPFKKTVYEKQVEAYTVDANLSNIENLDIFGEFSKEQLELIKQNNFVVNPSKEEQLFYIYEDNEYKSIPSFITTDSVLQVYHIFYDYTLRVLESEKLLDIIEELTDTMLEDSIKLYEKIENKEVKEAQLKNIAYFSIAQLALEKALPNNVPAEAKTIAEAELEIGRAHV